MSSSRPFAPASRMALICAIVFGSGLPRSSEAGPATWFPTGRPVSGTSGPQLQPSIAPDGEGGAFIALIDLSPSAPGYYLQHVTRDGETASGWPLGGLPLSVPHSVLGTPDVVRDGNGNAFVCWGGDRLAGVSVYMQCVSGSGAIAGGWPDGGRVIADTDLLRLPHLTADGAGGAIMAWSNGSSLLAQRVTSGGSLAPGWPEGGLSISSIVATFSTPQIVTDGAGGAIVAWSNNGEVFLQRVGANGQIPPGWPASGVPVAAGSAPHLVSDGAGGVIVIWLDDRNAAITGGDIYAQRVTGNGTHVQGWLPGGNAICAAPGLQDLATLGADGEGGAIVVWTDRRSDPDGDLYAQRITAQGAPAAGWPINGLKICGAAHAQQVFQRPVVQDGTGGAIITWADARSASTQSDIYAQRVLGDGVIAAGWQLEGVPVCGEVGPQTFVNAAANGQGGAILTWQDGRGSLPNVYVARITPDGSTPVLISLVSAAATPEGVRVRWSVDTRFATSATLYRSDQEDDWAALALLTANGTGELSYEDHGVVPGSRYGYRLGIPGPDGEAWSEEVWIDVPAGPGLVLRASSFNTGGSIRVSLDLPESAPAVLDLFDVRGRHLTARAIEPTAGTQVMDVGTGLASGVYVLRLSQGTRRRTAKTIVTR